MCPSFSETAVAPPRSVSALVAGLRPRQWLKNLLVFAAPAAAGILGDPAQVRRAGIVFLGLCAVSSALYLINDIGDVEADRLHPVKRARPIASGALSIPAALVAASVLMVGGLALVASVRLAALALVVLYVATASAYTFAFKHVAVLELFIVAAGFVIRAGVGGVATNIPVTAWFLTVASFGSFAIVVGKRSCERNRSDLDPAATRSVLARYTPQFLSKLQIVSIAGTLLSYAMWAYERSSTIGRNGWFLEVSFAPFAIAVLRYLRLIQRGEAEVPEEAIFADPTIALLGALWLGCFVMAIHSL
ncbi:MAG TPA: decaprenyl-phosphate phosphoribosyltransferase [Acidimicrobiales bacterium]|nr:decaprenyl-phosphate phosphoribosyltransferase [Acidimicrobiales bacterium]